MSEPRPDPVPKSGPPVEGEVERRDWAVDGQRRRELLEREAVLEREQPKREGEESR